MEVLIVSKTHMKNGVCVGGLANNGRFVRLLDNHSHHQPSDSTLEVRQIYDVTFSPRSNPILPHSEDVLVQSMEYRRTLNSNTDLIEYITERGVRICNDNLEQLFQGSLKKTQNGSAYINADNIPEQSVAFWISDKNLTRTTHSEKNYYSYALGPSPFAGSISIPYVGFQPAVDQIPSGTLIRVSLARWWTPDEATTEKRCYLQLSGWYA